MGKKVKYVLAVLIIIIIFLVVLYQTVLIKRDTFFYEDTGEVYRNPMTGFAPNADYVEAVGDNTLVYLDVTWKELEPQEGSYDFETIEEENYLSRWRDEGKQVVFRFVCDEPSEEEHMDIPDWLYELTQDGTFYDTDYGKGYSPNYENETFIAYHKKAIEALGEAFGQDSFVCFVELGSVGHWGEWHVKSGENIEALPSEEILAKYVTPYVDAFPHAKLLMRRPFSYVTTYQMGVFNDMTGDVEDTKEWLSWIEAGGVYDASKDPFSLVAAPKVWEQAPIGGEFTSGISMEEMLVTEQQRTLELLEDSHMTFIGPKCPIACEEELSYPKETQAVLGKLGYRYGVTEATMNYDSLRKQVLVKLCMTNYGVAPMYYDWPVCIYELDENRQVIQRCETDLQLSKIVQNEKMWTEVSMKVSADSYLEKGQPLLAVGIENPQTGEPAVYLDMDSQKQNYKYDLNQ